MALPGVEEKSTASPAEHQPESNRRKPVWQVIVLSVLTIFTYPVFWFYKNLKQLKAVADASDEIPQELISDKTRAALISLRKLRPGLFTLGLLVPMFHLLLVWQFFAWSAPALSRALIGLAAGVPDDCRCRSDDTTGGSSISGVSTKDPGWKYLFALNAALPLAFAQHLLNGFWNEIEGHRKKVIVRQAFSGGELIALVFGGVLLGLVVAGAGVESELPAGTDKINADGDFECPGRFASANTSRRNLKAVLVRPFYELIG